MTAPAADPWKVLSGPGYTSPTVRVSALAMTAFVFGLLAFPIPPLAVVALVFGIIGLAVTRSSVGGRSYARGGLILGITAAVMWLTIIASIVAVS